MDRKNFRLPFGRDPDDAATGDIESLREEQRQLKRAVEELSILNDLARAIGGSSDSGDIIRKIVDRSMRAVLAQQTVVTMLDRNPGQPVHTLYRAMTSSSEHKQFRFNEILLGWMLTNMKPLLANDPVHDDRIKGAKWDDSIHSILCVPLMVKSELIGVITSYNKKQDGGFTEEDQRLLSIIAAQSAQVIENARLYEEEKRLAVMREQLKMAAQIQRDLLPKSLPQLPGYDIAATSVAAQVVGGDYYDFIHIKDQRWGVCLGDVSGKGMPAAILMGNLQATLRGQAALDTAVGETIARSNRLLYQSTDPEKFATLFMTVLDASRHTLSFCNAGHEYPLIFRPGATPRQLSTGGVALGVLEDFPYQEETTSLEPGDTLVIYSDGISDAIDPLENPFGEQRLVEVVTANAGASAGELIQRILDAVSAHEKGAARFDDLTVVVVKRSA